MSNARIITGFLKEWKDMCYTKFFEMTAKNINEVVESFSQLYYGIFNQKIHPLNNIEEIMQIIANASDSVTFFPKIESSFDVNKNTNDNPNTEFSLELLQTHNHIDKDVKAELIDLLNALLDLYASKRVISCSFALALTAKIIGFFDDNIISIYIENLSNIAEVYSKLNNPILSCSIILLIQKMFTIRNFFSTQSDTTEISFSHNVIHSGLIEIILVLLRQTTFVEGNFLTIMRNENLNEIEKAKVFTQMTNSCFVQKLAASVFKELLDGIEYQPPRTKVLHMIEIYTHINNNESNENEKDLNGLSTIYEKYNMYAQIPLVHQIKLIHKINSRYIIENILSEIINIMDNYIEYKTFMKQSTDLKCQNGNKLLLINKIKFIDERAVVVLLDCLRNEIMLKCMLTSPSQFSKLLSWTVTVLISKIDLTSVFIRNSARGFLTAALFIDFMLPMPSNEEDNDNTVKRTKEICDILRLKLETEVEKEKLKYIVESGFAEYLHHFDLHPRAVKKLDFKEY